MNGLLGDKTHEFLRRYWPAEEGAPKHERLRKAFADAIANGFWTAGMRLPSEAELTAVMPCSLGTIQRALRALSYDGLIERRRGSGSIVAGTGGQISDPWHMRFFAGEGSQSTYFPVATRVLGRTIIHGQGPWSSAIQQGKEAVVKIDRIFTIDGHIDIFAEFFAVASKFPELLEIEESGLVGINLKQLIAQRHHAPIHKVRQRLRFEKLHRNVLKHGKYAAGVVHPILNVVAYSIGGEPTYYQDFFLPLTECDLDLGVVTRHG